MMNFTISAPEQPAKPSPATPQQQVQGNPAKPADKSGEQQK